MIYQVEVLNPEAQSMLESLVRLKLIRLHELNSAAPDFWEIIEHLRSQDAENALTESEIQEEIETVRAKRYERAAQSHH
jgi:hypothetical protein